MTGNTHTEPLTFMRIERLSSSIPFLADKLADKPADKAIEPEMGCVTVDDITIEASDILAEAQHHPSDDANAAVQSAARALVIKALLMREAQRQNVVAEPEIDTSGRLETDDDAVIRTLIEQQVNVPVASDADCQRYYDNHTHKFCSDTIHEVRHILLASTQQDNKQRDSQKELARTLIQHLVANPAEFDALAKLHSDCPSREQGGNLGQLTTGSTVREFEQALANMKPGEIAASPLETRFGIHIVKVEQRIPGNILPFHMVKDRIAAWLEASSWSRAVSQYVAILAGKSDIKGISLAAADSPLVQ